MPAWLAPRQKLRSHTRPILAAIAGLLLLTACTVKPKSREDETTTDFRQISRAYDLVIDGKKRPPKDVSELRPILHDLHQAKMGDEPDKVLTSARDGQPYVIIYNVPLGLDGSNDVFIYEKNGANGARYVMTVGRVVSQVADSSFFHQSFAKGHRPER
ncbi:hypothetical protein ETAA8_32500 [Anatilimnocola aggregata]|uniref:Uncharacterized protein n=1 Tax=Anatilimnocola aggregata TaxID=2528021 RepID=A0A517YD38_9BACT|nr:hypothetical protein [Anatilimnocola aggregata]QDU28150.1 hypothetical protein ETAA8_32500 [Anatilimnocola aggregata]